MCATVVETPEWDVEITCLSFLKIKLIDDAMDDKSSIAISHGDLIPVICGCDVTDWLRMIWNYALIVASLRLDAQGWMNESSINKCVQ